MPDFAEFERLIDYQFADKALLQEALTHRSFINETKDDDRRDNERLEFLGDAVLDFIVADMLFRRFLRMPEGELTQLRSALVKTESLARLGQGCQIGRFILMGKGEARSGGRVRANILCRTFEAFVGAVYMDGGLAAVHKVIHPRMEQQLDFVITNALHRDARSELQELSQSELSLTPRYRMVGTEGPEHEKAFLVEVVIDSKVIGRGAGSSKRLAAQAAAREALQRLEKEGWPE